MTTKLTEKEREELHRAWLDYSMAGVEDYIESLLEKKVEEAQNMGYSIGLKYMRLLHETNKREFGRLIEELVLEIKDKSI